MHHLPELFETCRMVSFSMLYWLFDGPRVRMRLRGLRIFEESLQAGSARLWQAAE